MQLKFTPLAQRDLESIGDYIAAENPRRAVTFVRELRAHCNSICHFPLSYPLRPDITENIRSSAYGNYVIYFVADDDIVLIIRILHGARDAAVHIATHASN
jgi:toxin ParE1/3/4